MLPVLCFFLFKHDGGEIWKDVSSGDSMLARVKLKEIDGRTPQGVECAA